MSFVMQKVARDKPHNIDCRENTYHEIVIVKNGKCVCERMSTMVTLRSRGYVEVKPPEAKAAPEKKAPKKKAAPKKKKTKAAPKKKKTKAADKE